ncbi:DUF4105 domain-containing protein [Fulvivirgaceae bacterium BMA10]|uniref:DUF4105 domain-containing protein n=1 Tax=Splendidivirga corallicola TaxID=3051826 RepID=A0ABT8KUL0_9BACT|nr:DUF4105 domain-containing protein [Fulvivirgaceae bacterium BMA10]
MIFRKVLLISFLILFSSLVKAQPGSVQLSSQAEISVITVDPGQEALFTVFGHSAFRVYDPVNRFDLAYNYGIFSFNQPNFYLNFAKGYLNYMLGVYDFQLFADQYEPYHRSIYEQVLDLDQEQKQRLFDFLQNNALPENRFYYYDYFYDNCATKIKDVLKEVLGDNIQFHGGYVTDDRSFRHMVDDLTVYKPWGDFGIDVCLGLPMDKIMNPEEYMFLPEYIFKGMESATLASGNGSKPLVKASTQYLDGGEPIIPNVNLFTPNVVFWSLCIAIGIVSFLGYRKQKIIYTIDVIIFGIIGLLGLFLLLLWIATDHKAAANNLNLLWAIPFHFPIAIMLLKKNKHQFLKQYFFITTCLMLTLLVGWSLIPQGYNVAFFPIILMLGIRAWYLYFNLNKISNKTVSHKLA